MKHAPLLPMIFVVITLGLVHVQFKGQTHSVPVKEIVALGVMIAGSRYLYGSTRPQPKDDPVDAVERSASADDDLDMAA